MNDNEKIPPTDDEREAQAEEIISRHLSRLAKQGTRWAEDDTAIGGQAANLVRQLAEAGLLRRSEVPSARRDPDPLWDRCYDDGSRMMSPANATESAGEAR